MNQAELQRHMEEVSLQFFQKNFATKPCLMRAYEPLGDVIC